MVKIVHLQNKSEEKTIMYFKTFLPFKSAAEGYPCANSVLKYININITLLVSFENFFIMFDYRLDRYNLNDLNLKIFFSILSVFIRSTFQV